MKSRVRLLILMPLRMMGEKGSLMEREKRVTLFNSGLICSLFSNVCISLCRNLQKFLIADIFKKMAKGEIISVKMKFYRKI